MFRRSLLIAILLSVIVAFSGAAQTPVRDSTAVLTVERSIAAMGGVISATQIASVVVLGVVQPAQGSEYRPAEFVWKSTATEFRNELRRGDYTQVFMSAHGRPAILEGDRVHRLNSHVATASDAFHIPIWLLTRKVSDPAFAFSRSGVASVSGAPAERVTIRLGTIPAEVKATSQEWFFDVTSGLPLRVEFWVPENLDANKGETSAFEFADFRDVSGVMVPFRITIYRQGSPFAVALVSSISFNVPIDPSDFDPPAGGIQ